MQPEKQALVGVFHLEAAVLDALGDETLTLYQLRRRLFPDDDAGSADIVNGILDRLAWNVEIDCEQAAERQHYRYRRFDQE